MRDRITNWRKDGIMTENQYEAPISKQGYKDLMDLSIYENTVAPNQLASDKTIWSGSTLFYPLIENTCLYNWNAAC